MDKTNIIKTITEPQANSNTMKYYRSKQQTIQANITEGQGKGNTMYMYNQTANIT